MYFHDLTGVLDKKKFSIFGEVKADKKKVTKNLKDSDDGLGADLKQWMQGLFVDSSSVVCVTDACDVSYLAFNQIQYFFLSEASFDVICVTEQHYVSIFFTRLWSVQTALILDTQNAKMKTALILDTQNAEILGF